MTYSEDLADRVRSILATQKALREVRMFGGLAFMVNGAMAVCVGSPGADLLVRIDPERCARYEEVDGARIAEMGQGRSTGPGWLAVDAANLSKATELAFWVDAALEFNGTKAASGTRRPNKAKTAR